MIEALMAATNNYFIKKQFSSNNFAISGGAINIENELPLDSYFMIEGSLFNDGVHKNDSSHVLIDEEFSGSVYLLAPPKEFIKLAHIVHDFQLTHQPTGYTSESFDGYSYSKEAADADNWQNVFKAEIKRWRRL